MTSFPRPPVPPNSTPNHHRSALPRPIKSILTPAASAPRPTRSRFFVTPAVGAGCLLGVASLAAQPAHLVKRHQLVDEIVAAQSLGAFTGVVDGATVFLNRDGGSWNTPGNLSFIRFFDAHRAANVGPYAANLTECAQLVTHLLKTTYNWNWSQNLIPDPLNQGALVAKSSPGSYLYVSAIKHQIGFAAQVTNFLNVQPGDSGARWDVGTSSGHTMLVVGVNLDSAKAYRSRPPTSTSCPIWPAPPTTR